METIFYVQLGSFHPPPKVEWWTAPRINGSYFTVNWDYNREMDKTTPIVTWGLNDANLNSVTQDAGWELIKIRERLHLKLLEDTQMSILCRASLQPWQTSAAADLWSGRCPPHLGLDSTSEFLSESETWSLGGWGRNEEFPLPAGCSDYLIILLPPTNQGRAGSSGYYGGLCKPPAALFPAG